MHKQINIPAKGYIQCNGNWIIKGRFYSWERFFFLLFVVVIDSHTGLGVSKELKVAEIVWNLDFRVRRGGFNGTDKCFSHGAHIRIYTRLLRLFYRIHHSPFACSVFKWSTVNCKISAFSNFEDPCFSKHDGTRRFNSINELFILSRRFFSITPRRFLRLTSWQVSESPGEALKLKRKGRIFVSFRRKMECTESNWIQKWIIFVFDVFWKCYWWKYEVFKML